tara:strand:- start:572 stop:967 length:396 start_codon:yes stop_codon:yes gene_type:complete
MTVAVSSPAKKTTPRKRRSRKSTTSTTTLVKEVQKSKVSPKAKVSSPKYQQPVEIKKVTETKATKVRPANPTLTIADYTADIKVRWEIHQWETQELWNDMVKGYNNVKPFVVQSVNYLKESYDRAFNETSK